MAVVARVEVRSSWPSNGKHWLMELIYVDFASDVTATGTMESYYDTWFEVHDPRDGDCEDCVW